MTRFLPRPVLVLFATSALGACATPNFPITRAEAGVAPAALPVAPYARPAVAHEADDLPLTVRPTPAVESRELDPPQLILAAQHRRAKAAPKPDPQDEADAAPEPRAVKEKTVTGRVVEVEGPPVTYTVKKGDSLEKIAGKLGTDVDELKTLNKLKRSTIQPGQELKGPRGVSKAYVVGRDDTLEAVAKRFGVTEKALKAENGIGRRGGIRPGQKLKLPDGYRDHGPITVTTKADAEPAAPAPKRVRGKVEAADRAPPAEADRVEADGSRTVVTRSVTGRVVEVEGPPRTYEVKKGDTLEKVADKLDTDIDQLKKDNKLKKSLIKPGQTLKGPPTTAKAYVVGSGDTIFSIGRRFGVTADALREENGLSKRASIHTGEKLRLPAGYRDRGPLTTTERTPAPPPAAAPRPRRTEPAPAPAAVSDEGAPPEIQPPLPARTPPAPATSLGPQPYTPSVAPTAPTPRPYTPAPRPYTPAPRPYMPAPSSTPSAPRPYIPPPGSASGPPLAPQAAAPLTDAQISELGRGRFLWPIKGQILSDFGPKTPGQRNDGVNIQANAGDPVRAAAAGDVVYAGDQVPGFGNLVLVKHADGWVTAYGHLSRVEVKMQQKVAQGQEIGQAGSTGGVAEPQLHFEVRYAPTPMERARPIDPKLVLPR